MNINQAKNTHEPPIDFVMFIDQITTDILDIAKAGHNTAAFTALNMILAKCYLAMTGVDPLSDKTPVGPQEVLDWAKANIDRYIFRRTKYNHPPPVSEDLIQVIQLIAIDLEKAVKAGTIVLGFVVGLEVALSRAYYVLTGLDGIALVSNYDKGNNVQKALLEWAWGFKVSERETKLIV